MQDLHHEDHDTERPAVNSGIIMQGTGHGDLWRNVVHRANHALGTRCYYITDINTEAGPTCAWASV